MCFLEKKSLEKIMQRPMAMMQCVFGCGSRLKKEAVTEDDVETLMPSA